MDWEERKKRTDLTGVVRNSISEKNAIDKAIIKETDQYFADKKTREAEAFHWRRKWRGEPAPDPQLRGLQGRRHGTVIEVLDGNALHLTDTASSARIRVRLYAVDAPELNQQHGKEAKAYVEKFTLGKEVEYKVSSDKHAYRVMIWEKNEGNLNIAMIKRGHAMKLIQFEDDYARAFIEEEMNAKVAKVGMWAYPDSPRPAWEQRLNVVEQRQRDEERRPKGMSLVESSARLKQQAGKYDEEMKVWGAKWYVKILAPLGLGGFLKPPKFED